MLHTRGVLVWGLCALLGACRAAPRADAGTPDPVPERETLKSRPLQGRFLHVTDFHPDPFYETYSSTEAKAACHRKHGPAGVYGAETSGCDSPLSLVNETFKWINDNLKDKIDFIVWTGDSARHDNDEKIPRTQKQIIKQNELVVSKFTEVFRGSHAIPIVPTFGNNDIMPHNIFLSGPNRWTLKYLDIWRDFIPEAQRHQFQEGGWFYVEVIPQKLAVFSLNTMYFFDSNSGVDGCAKKKEPGYEHMEWLRIQLQILRDRGMKAILIGHVPPARTDSKLSWDETCWQKFTLWERQYRDVIVASLFGHMSIDHFMLQDFKELKKSTKKGRMSMNTIGSTDARQNMLEDGEVTVASASDYLSDLRKSWSKLPDLPKTKKNSMSVLDIDGADDDGDHSAWNWITSPFSLFRKGGKKGKGDKKKFLDKIGGPYAERFSVSHVSPSVVPNYFPTLRVFSYNVSGLDNTVIPSREPPLTPSYVDFGESQHLIADEKCFLDDEDWEREVQEIVALKKKKKEHDARKKRKKYKFKIPSPPSKSAPPGPAYSPQTLTLLGYVQYFANLTHINNDFVAQSQALDVENLENDSIFGLQLDESGNIEDQKWKEGKHGKHQGKKPRRTPHPKKFKFEVEYNTTDDGYFKLKDLTVRSYFDLARRIGKDRKKSVNLLEQSGVYEDGQVEEDDVIEVEKKKKKKRFPKNGPWYTFVKRAFVGSMDPNDILLQFGVEDEVPFGDESKEVTEL